MAIVVSFINMKGGVGKTTLAMQIALAASRAGSRVLAVDLDPQSNLSQSLLGLKKYRQHLEDNKPTVLHIFDGYVPASASNYSPTPADLSKIIIKKIDFRGNLDLIPCRLELSNILRNPAGKERRLAKALAKVATDYDLVVIDCAPTDSVLTDAAYFSSRYIIVPIKPEFMATIGLPLLAKSLKAFKTENEDHTIDIAGIAFVHSSTYSSGPEGRRAIDEVTDFSKRSHWHVFDTQMKYSASYAKSAREGRAIDQTSYVRWETTFNFSKLKDSIFSAIGLKT
jgi:chromosome partitioning protein